MQSNKHKKYYVWKCEMQDNYDQIMNILKFNILKNQMN